MVTSRTLFWRFFAYEVVTADKTLPCDVVIAFPYGARFHLIQISLKSLLMVCLNFGDGFEMVSNFGETLLACYKGCFNVSFHTFNTLFINGNLKVCSGVGNLVGVDN